MSDIVEALTEIVGPAAVSAGEAINDDDTHDEALTATALAPARRRAAGEHRARSRAWSSSRPVPACRSPPEVRVPASPARASPSRVASSWRSIA